MSRCVLILMCLCLASCKHPAPPDPAPGGVAIDAPFVRIRTNVPERLPPADDPRGQVYPSK